MLRAGLAANTRLPAANSLAEQHQAVALIKLKVGVDADAGRHHLQGHIGAALATDQCALQQHASMFIDAVESHACKSCT